ncbi:MAG: STAS domain-containing protein [Leptolyngbyaceae cyanobacterium MO_188.B28]|nr:STAS domain-containing protein [Leptolyngbyaceae cyanobacterium MO_188.B28]
MNYTETSVTIRVPKRVDVYTAQFLMADLNKKIQKGKTIVLDMTNTHHVEMDSVNVFTIGLLKSRERKAKLALRGVQPQISAVLRLAGVLGQFRRKTAGHPIR